MNADGTDAQDITRRNDIGTEACFSLDGGQLAVTMHDWPVTAEAAKA